MSSLKGKTILITGASRGIGEAIALRCARDGANVVVVGKSDRPHPKLEGTIHTVADKVKQAGGQALALKCDVRDEDNIAEVVAEIKKTFGGLDILVNNASAIFLAPTPETPMKRYDLMNQVNARGTFACSQACYSLLKESDNPHILNLSPPLSMEARWFAPHVAYTMSKFGMSMCTLGMSAEFKRDGIAVNSLWPRTTIATAAIAFNFPKEMIEASRKPSIVADAAHAILTKDAKLFTGRFCIDEDILKEEGVTDFAQYAMNPKAPLQTDLFLPA